MSTSKKGVWGWATNQLSETKKSQPGIGKRLPNATPIKKTKTRTRSMSQKQINGLYIQLK